MRRISKKVSLWQHAFLKRISSCGASGKIFMHGVIYVCIGVLAYLSGESRTADYAVRIMDGNMMRLDNASVFLHIRTKFPQRKPAHTCTKCSRGMAGVGFH